MKQAFAIFAALFVGTALPAKAEEHLTLLSYCLDRKVASSGDKVQVYSIQNAGDLSVSDLRCVFPKQVDAQTLHTGNYAIIYPSKFDHSILYDCPPPAPMVLSGPFF